MKGFTSKPFLQGIIRQSLHIYIHIYIYMLRPNTQPSPFRSRPALKRVGPIHDCWKIMAGFRNQLHGCKPWETNLSIVPHTLGVLNACITYCIRLLEYINESRVNASVVESLSFAHLYGSAKWRVSITAVCRWAFYSQVAYQAFPRPGSLASVCYVSQLLVVL